MKHIKENLVPFIFLTLIGGLLLFPIWSHFHQEKEIQSIKTNGNKDDLLVGASTLFAQNASIQGNLSFFGEIQPDGLTCSNNQILKKTGVNDWDCATDSTGSVTSNSLDFDEFVNAMTLDANTSVASKGFNFDWTDTQISFPGGIITTNGTVGIGTISPDSTNYNLDVGGASVFRDTIDFYGGSFSIHDAEGSGVGYYLYSTSDTLNSFIGMDSSTTLPNISFQGQGNGDDIFDVIITATGNVGIGTNSPTTKLQVSGSASISTNFETIGFASASAFKGSAFPATNCTGNDALQWSTTGIFVCSADFEPKDADLDAIAAFDSTAGYIVETGAATYAKRTLTGTANQIGITNGDGTIGNPVWSITTPFIIPGRASVSGNFEVLGFASISGAFTQNSVASNSFLGSLTGPTTGTLSVGTSDNPLKALWANIVHAVVSFFFPTYTGTSLTGSGNAAVQTASGSLDFNDSSVTKVLDGKVCKTFVVDTPTASNPGFVGPVRFDNPFTLTSVQMVASGSNAAGWNLKYGVPGTITTTVFGTNRSASTSLNPTYTSFTNSTLTDGQALEVVITSRSAVLQTFSVTTCGRYTH